MVLRKLFWIGVSYLSTYIIKCLLDIYLKFISTYLKFQSYFCPRQYACLKDIYDVF